MFTGMEYLQDGKAVEIAQLIVTTNPIIITSNYKGIILTQRVRVLSFVPERMIIQAPDLELCLTFQDRIHLYSSAFKVIISARVLTIDMVMGKLELSDLSFTAWHWNERQCDRVQPRNPIYVNVVHNRALIRATLDNLSVGGMSLMIYKYKDKVVPFDQDSVVRLTMQLPGDDTRLYLKGKVIHERQTGKLGIIGMQLMGSQVQEKRINRYVVARKAEIMAELKQTSRGFLNQQSLPCF
jgi:PilZ domain